jgi:NAD(P)H-dependent FMN reductase
MKIAIVTGSHRAEAQSERVGKYIQSELQRSGVEAVLISLSKNPLPLWDESVWSGAPEWKEKWGPISAELKSSDALVVVAPEWAGMVPPGLKNFFLLCSTADIGHKPGLIVAVTSGVSGAYPVAELRSSSYKNNRLVYIPDHVIIRDVENMLHGDQPASDHDTQIRARITYSLGMLQEYSKALAAVRASGKVNTKDFPFGM